MKPKQPSKNQKKQKNNRFQNFLAIGSVLCVGALVVTLGIAAARIQDENRKVNQIGKHFKCICEMQCSLTVAQCACTKPGGASERKAFIRDAFKRGMKEQDVFTLYNEKYGGLIPDVRSGKNGPRL